jgi:hypothetical protein
MGTLTPVQYVRPMEIGRSSPQLILFSDSHKYVVKFKNNRQGDLVLVNEYIANKLARLLKLPIPAFRTVWISEQFIQDNPVLLEHKFKAGHQVASRYIDNSFMLNTKFARLTRLGKTDIINRNKAAGLIVFDHWVSNIDRNLRNVLLEPDGKQYYIRMIDHANCFQRSVKNPNRFLPLEVRYFSSYEWCVSLLNKKEELTLNVNRILDIPKDKIKEIVQSLPEDWQVSEEEKKRIYRHIEHARNDLPRIIDLFIDQYVKK